MYHPTSRVLTVLELLQSRPRITGPELADRLEVDVRTVRRYITMLQDMGIPVEGGVGRVGGYSLRPGFKLPPLMFTEDEALVLTLGLLMARKQGVDGTSALAQSTLAKIERILPTTLQEKMKALQETTAFDDNGPAERVSASILKTLSEAARQNQRVELVYHTPGSDETQRLFDPYGLVSHENHWYTVGYCWLRDELRVFRLDRVRRVELVEARFNRPTNFNCLEYLIQTIVAIPDQWNIEVVLQTTLEEIRPRVPMDMASLETQPAGVVLRASLHDLDWVARFLAGLGCPFVIRQPVELRTALQKLATNLTQIAQKTDFTDN